MQSPGPGSQDPDAETQLAGGWPPSGGRSGASAPHGNDRSYGDRPPGADGHRPASYESAADGYDDGEQTRIVEDPDDYRVRPPDADARTQVMPGNYPTSAYGSPSGAGNAPTEQYGAGAYGDGGYDARQGGYPPAGGGHSQRYQQGYGTPDGYQQSGYQHSDYQQPEYEQPGYQQAGYQQPGYPQSGYQPPGYEQAGYQQAGYRQGDYQQGGYQQGGYDGYPPGPAGPGGPGRSRPGPRRAIIIGAVVVAALLLISIPVVLLSGGSDDKPDTAAPPSITATTPAATITPSPSPSPVASTAPSPSPSPSTAPPASTNEFTPAESALVAKLSPTAMTDCEPNRSAESERVQAALYCDSDDGKVVAAYSYPTANDMSSDVAARKVLVTDPNGKCKQGGAEVFTWNFDKGKTQGTAICSTQSDSHFIYWSYDDKLVAFMATGTDGAALYEWWSGFDPVPQG